MHMSLDDIEALARTAFMHCGAAEPNARSVARSIAAAEADGMRPVGLGYLPTYCGHLRIGKIKGMATPTIRQTGAASILVNGHGGFAHPAIDLGMPALFAGARQAGAAVLGVANTHSAGVVGYHLERIAAAGFLVLGCASAPRSMAPWGGKRAVFGTNPLGIAAPRRNGPPMVFDMASSQVIKVAVIEAAREGKPIPLGWAMDADGKPTTDAKAGLAGSMAPAGGYKGVGIAMMVELLAAVLTGSNLSHRAPLFADNEGGPPNVGQFFLAVEPDHFAPGFADRAEELFRVMTEEPGTRLPGDRRLKARERAQRDGVEVDDELRARLQAYLN